MAVGDRLVLATLAAGVGLLGSCSRNQLRKDPLRPVVTPPAGVVAPGPPPFIPPIPPDPPSVAPTAAKTPPPAGPVVPAGGPAPADPPAAVQVAGGPAPAPVADPPAPKADSLTSVRALLDAATARYAGVADYEARLVKREVVNGRAMPQDEIAYKVRVKPLSVSMKVLSETGKGREVIFVKGRDDRGMHVLTGKGDSRLVGAGFRTTVDPDSGQATAKSRYRIYDAGFGRTLGGLARAVAAVGTPGVVVAAIGPVRRPEFPDPVEGIEVRAPAGPILREGGTRRVFFDPDPKSPGYRLPVLVETTDPTGREVEYYWFSKLKTPAGLTDADFDPDRLGK